MVGKEHQRHACYMPYGTVYGERFLSVSAVKKNKKKKKEILNIDQINKMIWEDYTYQQIAQELKINPNIVKDHFEKEGLI
ncbi:hypothetical protein AB4X15_15765 [Peribacillus simplex]|uniref:hypothetical protein n=1 Tax=Peribacillus simplex TaxID=1478 RepID=UPI0034E8AED6